MNRIKNIGDNKKFGRTLREQNAKRYGIDNKTLKGLESFYCRTDTDKFTIVELLFRGRRYHGLSAKSNQDMSNLTEGIAHAYSRAFKNMLKQDIEDIIGKGPTQITIDPNLKSPLFYIQESKVDEELNNFKKHACNFTTIDLGGLPLKTPSAIADTVSSSDICKIECQHCGEITNYFAKKLNTKTECPICGKRLSEPVRPTEIARGSC